VTAAKFGISLHSRVIQSGTLAGSVSAIKRAGRIVFITEAPKRILAITTGRQESYKGNGVKRSKASE
jgi:hypothetical protein